MNILAWLDQKTAACEQRATQVDDELKFVYLDAARDNREARAAVAELSTRACDALELLEGIAPDHPRTAKLRAALSRIGGGK